MKKFVVSEKCIACGNCLLETKLLQEDAEGKAVPVNGGYFSDDFLAKAEEIVGGCPVQALSIAEGAGADLTAGKTAKRFSKDYCSECYQKRC